MAQGIKAGDVVELKSGGPKMTVSHVVTGGNLRCFWFVGGDLKDGSFTAESLAMRAPEVEDDARARAVASAFG